MKKVITYGTFDLFHRGHLNIINRAKQYGDYLIVAVSSDEFNKKKGKQSYYNQEERMEIVAAIKGVDEVILETNWDQKVKNIREMGIATFAIGDDWEGKFDDLEEICEVVYLKRTEGISSSLIKNELSTMRGNLQ